MNPIVFRYKPIRGRLGPIITIGVKIADIWLPIEVYVDSGAAFTVFHARTARSIAFDYQIGELSYLQVGDGGFIPIYLHNLEIQIGTERFTARVGFSEKLGVGFNLLGRTDIFDRFKICFQESQGILTFESGEPGIDQV